MENAAGRQNTFAHIGLAQILTAPNNPAKNLRALLDWVQRAKNQGIDLIAFPEMAIPGYLIGDEWENDSFIRDCLDANEELRKASSGIAIVWGNIDADFTKLGEDGRTRKYNAAWIAANGKWVSNGILEGRSYKTLLPSYREFEDKRHFFPLDKWAQERGLKLEQALQPFRAPLQGETECKIGLMLCEDMWDADYHQKPGRILAQNGAEVCINLSCSPWTWRKNDKRHRVAAALVSATQIPLYYVNSVGIQNNGKDIFALDGASTIYSNQGAIVAMSEPFAESILTIQSGIPTGMPTAPTSENDIAEILSVLVKVISTWFSQNGTPPVAIGLSGGIDSALVATLLAIALGPEKVWAVNMPSRFNSETTRTGAAQLAHNLGIHYAIVPIQESVDHTIQQIESAVWTGISAGDTLKLSGLNRENIQARDRGGRVLAALASAIGGVFTNNGNKTETAFGYATLYGDINGAFAPLGDLYKTQVYALARHINQGWKQDQLSGLNAGMPLPFSCSSRDELIPLAILNVVPSAELSENQNVDEGKGDPILYTYHDPLLYQFIDGGFQKDYLPAYGRREPYDLLRWYLSGEIDMRLGLPPGTTQSYFSDTKSFVKDLEEKWTWYKRNTFKRIQSPPIIALSKRAFGFDLRESMNGVYFSAPYCKLRDSVLPPLQ